jgi:uncharacterized metal-binding protein YceD (DUF177 family)
MIIDISQLKQNQSVEINGQESWLDKIYDSFGKAPKDKEKPLITGKVDILVENPTYVQIIGSVEYSPYLDCSRCSLPITWPLKEEFDIYLLREKPQFAEEQDLDESEMSEYYMEDNRNFDLEVAINDALQTERPFSPVIKDEYDQCVPCGADLSSNLMGSSENADKASPFAALKDMKLKH